MSSFKRKVKTTEVVTATSTDAGADSASAAPTTTSTTTTSSFQEAIAPISGWKPWIHSGQGVVSSGNRQLDELMGGGIPLGTILLNLTENFSNYGQTLFLYNLAEGISHGHNNLVVAGSVNDAEDLLQHIPTNSHLEKEDPSLKTEDVRKRLKGDDENDENDKEDGEKESGLDSATSSGAAANDWGLKIAWQYQKYLNNASKEEAKQLNIKTDKLPFCCSYDLSRRMHERLLQTHMEIYLSNDIESAEESLKERLEKILNKIKSFITTNIQTKPQSVSRIFLSSFHEIINSLERQLTTTNYEEDLRTIGMFILRLKRLIRNKRVVIVMSLNPTMMKSCDNLILEQAVDTVLSVESFAGKAHVVPYEFREYLGFFIIKKLQHVGMLAPFQPARGTRFGIKRDRRKLHIEPLHLPPEESRAFGSSCSDTKPIEATISKSFENVGSVEKKSTSVSRGNDHHGHDHSHGHSHGHLEHGMEKMKLSYETNNAPSSSSTLHNVTSTTNNNNTSESSTNSTAAPPKSSLAASLAAARANRQAAKEAAGNKSGSFTPISISRNATAKPPSNQSIDF